MNSSSRHLIEVCGYIKKQEILATIDTNVLPHSWVLESLHPFPGYHGKNLPDESDPRSIFLMVHNGYTFEQVARIVRKIHQNFPHSFNATEGTIYFQPYTYHCIRLKYLSSFKYIAQLQEFFENHGVKFMKKREMEKEGLIQINKNFLVVEEQVSGIYRDMNNRVKCYVEIPEKAEWEDFKRYTHQIKNNLVDNNFDAALGAFYRKKGIVDVVRIYEQDHSLDKLHILKQRYEEEIRKSYK